MGIYSSKLSCWQRRKAGLKQDNAGPNTIDETVIPEVVAEEVVEEVVVEEEAPVVLDEAADLEDLVED